MTLIHIEAPPSACTQEGFYLLMNPVYDRAEAQRAFGPFQSLQDAADYHQSQLVVAEDGQPTRNKEENDPYRRSFQSGPLFNMNPLSPVELSGQLGRFEHGIIQLRPVRAMRWFSALDTVPPQF